MAHPGGYSCMLTLFGGYNNCHFQRLQSRENLFSGKPANGSGFFFRIMDDPWTLKIFRFTSISATSLTLNITENLTCYTILLLQKYYSLHLYQNKKKSLRKKVT